MENRFWNKLEFVTPMSLKELWKARKEIDITARGLFAVVVNEFANGNISHHPWSALLSTESLLEVLQIGLWNVGYLLLRSSQAGINSQPISRAFVYVILAALDALPAEKVARFITDSLFARHGDEMPEYFQDFLLMPIMSQLLSEMQDVCSSDCARVSSTRRDTFTKGKDEIDEYWLRFEPEGVEEETPEQHFLVIEAHYKPCVVGFPVGKKNGCPLFKLKPSVKNIEEVLAVIKRVACFRKSQAAEKRAKGRA